MRSATGHQTCAPFGAKPKRRHAAAFFCLAAGLSTSPEAQGTPQGTAAHDLRALLAGVRQIAAPEGTGTLLTYGPDAFSVVVSRGRSARCNTTVAASRLGKGRVVALSSRAYFSVDALTSGETARFLENVLRWAAGLVGDAPIRPLVLGAEAQALGTVNQLTLRNAPSAPAVGLSAGRFAVGDVVVAFTHALSKPDMADVERFVREGGGAVLLESPWQWMTAYPGSGLSTHVESHLLAAAGIKRSYGKVKNDHSGDLPAATPPPWICDPFQILSKVADQPNAEVTAEEQKAIRWTMSEALRHVPRSTNGFRTKLDRLIEEHAAGVVPTTKDPIRPTLATRIAVQAAWTLNRSRPAAKLGAHPSAHFFPGSVPNDAETVTVRRKIDLQTPGWHPTGLYAAAGQPLTIRRLTPRAQVKLQIGAHTDTLWSLAEWKRMPAVVRSRKLRRASTQAASEFGGLVYLVVDRPAAGHFEVEISGAVPAPLFVQNKTRPDEWRHSRTAVAPWADLTSAKIALTVPSTAIRGLQDPEALLAFWDQVADAASTLAGSPKERPRPERYVTDVQISAGYMHAGYPIMTHLDMASTLVDVDRLRSGAHGVWGLYHELGHNHQNTDWTFTGTVEVTCNLFTLFIFDKICGLSAEQVGRGGDAYHRELIAPYRAANKPFQMWKERPFLALQMYAQMQRAFGWAPFVELFSEYRALPSGHRPKSDQDKRDQWLVRFSRKVGRNLGPFFETWSVPTTQAARDSIAALPRWLPDDAP